MNASDIPARGSVEAALHGLDLNESDAFALRLFCSEALETWQRAVHHHYGMRSLGDRMANRCFLEQSWDELRAAWDRACTKCAVAAA